MIDEKKRLASWIQAEHGVFTEILTFPSNIVSTLL